MTSILLRTVSRIQKWWHLPPSFVAFLQLAVFGIGGGFAAVLFHFGVLWLYRLTFLPLSRLPKPVFAVGSFFLITGTALIAGRLLQSFYKKAAGSGIPELKAAFWKDFGYMPLRLVWVKFLAGVLTIGGGSSLGREGPSVQLAGAVGSNLAGWMGAPKQNRRLGAAAGAAAGLAAAFNTPLAAVTFVLEEILQDLNSRLLGSILFAAVIGTLVTQAFFGRHPSIQLAHAAASGWIVYLLIPLAAITATLVGAAFQHLTLLLRRECLHGRLAPIPAWLRPAVGTAPAWMAGVIVFWHTGRLGVFGLGYADLSDGLTFNLSWQIAGILLVAKLVATVFCYGLGGCGGIFAPTLFFGAMSGLWTAGMISAMTRLQLSPADHILLGVVGMSACLGAVVRAPMTGILIVFEMTHDFNLVPALILGTLISQAVGRLLMKHNFYDEVLHQDGHVIQQVRPPRDLFSWQQWPVSAVANYYPVCLSSLDRQTVEKCLSNYPYDRFPVLTDGRISGILKRSEAEAALASKRTPRIDAPVICAPDTPIQAIQLQLVESSTGVVLLANPADQEILGMLTLHDLLRAQMMMAESEHPDGDHPAASRQP